MIDAKLSLDVTFEIVRNIVTCTPKQPTMVVI